MTIRTEICHIPAQNAGIKGIFARIVIAHTTWCQRQKLNRLDAAALEDLGLTRHQAETEAQKPIWDVPAHWKH